MKWTFRANLPGLATAGLLLVMAAGDGLDVDFAAAAPFHARVRGAINAVPASIGSWRGEDLPIPHDVLDLLHPNAALHRRYTDESGHSMELLIVQCTDARDMRGHCPDVCYPANGWLVRQVRPVQVDLPGRPAEALEYELERQGTSGMESLFVRSFFVMPEGNILKDMNSLIAAAKDYRMLPFGAAQFQVAFNGSVGLEDRNSAFIEVVASNRPLIRTMQSGGIQ